MQSKGVPAAVAKETQPCGSQKRRAARVPVGAARGGAGRLLPREPQGPAELWEGLAASSGLCQRARRRVVPRQAAAVGAPAATRRSRAVRTGRRWPSPLPALLESRDVSSHCSAVRAYLVGKVFP